MDAAVAVSSAVKKATVATCILRIVLDQFAVIDDHSNLVW